jgi:hypothetical protein
MKEIFQEYGGILITVVAIVALILVIRGIVASNGAVGNAFNDLITGFVEQSDVIGQSTQAASQAVK